jgi:hypothetical protein
VFIVTVDISIPSGCWRKWSWADCH